jgi:hypothetical protein
MLVLLVGEVMMYAVEMASCGMMTLPSFMKISRDFRAILRFALSNLNCCNVGTDN